jgi:hypothetical protein
MILGSFTGPSTPVLHRFPQNARRQLKLQSRKVSADPSSLAINTALKYLAWGGVKVPGTDLIENRKQNPLDLTLKKIARFPTMVTSNQGLVVVYMERIS